MLTHCNRIWQFVKTEWLMAAALLPSFVVIFLLPFRWGYPSVKPPATIPASVQRSNAEYKTFAEYGPIEEWLRLPFDDRIRVCSEIGDILFPDAPHYRRRDNCGMIYDAIIRSSHLLREEEPMIDQLEDVMRDIQNREIREHLISPGKRL